MHELKLVMHEQHSIATMNLVTLYFWLMYITTGGYVPLYITSKVITLQLMRCSVLADYVHWKNRWVISTQLLVVLPQFQTTHLSSYSNPLNFWVTMPNYFAVDLTSHARLLQPTFTLVILPFKVMVWNDSKVELFLPWF